MPFRDPVRSGLEDKNFSNSAFHTQNNLTMETKKATVFDPVKVFNQSLIIHNKINRFHYQLLVLMSVTTSEKRIKFDLCLHL